MSRDNYQRGRDWHIHFMPARNLPRAGAMVVRRPRHLCGHPARHVARLYRVPGFRYSGCRPVNRWALADCHINYMGVFEEVDGIDRMKAFGLAFFTGTVFFILTTIFLTPKH